VELSVLAWLPQGQHLQLHELLRLFLLQLHADEVFLPVLPKHLSGLVAVPSCLQRVTLCEKDYLERLAVVQSVASSAEEL